MVASMAASRSAGSVWLARRRITEGVGRPTLRDPVEVMIRVRVRTRR